MPGFGRDMDEPLEPAFNPGVSSLPHRKDDSLARLALAARMPEPGEPAPKPRALHPTLPLSPSQLKAAHAPEATPKKSGPRMTAAATPEASYGPGPTVPESISAFGRLSDGAAEPAKQRRAFGQDKPLPARTQQLMEAVKPEDAARGPAAAPRLAPRVVAGGKPAGERPGLPGAVYLAVGLIAGIGCTLLAVWLLT